MILRIFKYRDSPGLRISSQNQSFYTSGNSRHVRRWYNKKDYEHLAITIGKNKHAGGYVV